MAPKADLLRVDPDDLIIIGRDTQDDDKHPLYDERAFLDPEEKLVKNIMAYGVILPIRARKEAGKMLVVDGRQRVLASRKAKALQSSAGEAEVKVPVILTEGDDGRVVGVMISANEQRLDDDLLVKATKCARFIEITGASPEDAGIAFGKSITTIKNWLNLAKADSRVHDAYRKGQISASAAMELAKLPREEQVAGIEKYTSSNTGQRMSESRAKKVRQEAQAAQVADTEPAAETTDGAAAQPAETAGKKKSTDKKGKKGAAAKPKSGKQAIQQGVKRTWVRASLKTEAAKKLSADQRGVLEWFAYGTANKGDWFDTFYMDVELERGA